jgi:hypothetical protein
VVEATKTMVEEETGTISGMQIMYMINPLWEHTLERSGNTCLNIFWSRDRLETARMVATLLHAQSNSLQMSCHPFHHQ